MTIICLDSDDLFLYIAPGSDTIGALKAKKPDQPSFASDEWTVVKNIKLSCDQLELFNCVIQGPQLKQLAQELQKTKWLVNREGCIYTYAPDAGSNYRINDFFGWSKYGVHPSRHTVWNKVELNTKDVVIDITEKDKSLADYKQKLESMEQVLSSCKEQLEKMEEKLSVCQKKLKELEAKKEEELSSYKKLMKEKEEELSCLEIHITKKEEEFKSMENELSQIKKSLDEKVRDLNVAKEEMEVNRRELLVWVTLWERQLNLEDPWRGKQQDDFKKMQEELSLYKKIIEMMGKELKEVNHNLVIERKKVNAFRAAIKCLVTFLEDHNTCLGKRFNYEIMLPTLCDPKHVDSLERLGGGVTISEIASTLLQIAEQQNYVEGEEY